MTTEKSRKDCIAALRVYLGISPYQDHRSVGSGYYFNWLKIRYGEELVNECIKELRAKLPNCS